MHTFWHCSLHRAGFHSCAQWFEHSTRHSCGQKASAMPVDQFSPHFGIS
ncbi:hypothetical protein AB0953_31020 [Streptomyces sp. NPDC046866]